MKIGWANEYNDKFKPITEAQKKYHAKRAAKYIFVHDKMGNATCSKCGREIVVKAKHKGEATCPECKAKLIVQHDWRISKYLENIEWMVIPHVINPHVICLRFILAYQRSNKPMEISERARMYIDDKHSDPEYYCGNGNKWHKGKAAYFIHPSYIMPNRFYCMYAYEYPRNFFKEIDKMDCFKYCSSKYTYSDEYIASQIGFMIKGAGLNEKLSKVGLGKIVDGNRGFYMRGNCYRLDPMFDYKATSLTDMLRLSKAEYDALKHSPTFDTLYFLQKHTANLTNFATAGYNTERYYNAARLAERTGLTFNKMCKYLINSGVDTRDYIDYLNTLEKLNINIKDSYYSMPKNFKEADQKAIMAYTEKVDREAREKASKRDGEIKKISDALRAMPNLKEFLKGSDGLLVYVPESSGELITEGRLMHNCIGTYVDRIAEKKTMVFFVRRLNDPTAPFVAMEICNGEIIQIREDHNKAVTDTKILDFCQRFADALKAA